MNHFVIFEKEKPKWLKPPESYRLELWNDCPCVLVKMVFLVIPFVIILLHFIPQVVEKMFDS